MISPCLGKEKQGKLCANVRNQWKKFTTERKLSNTSPQQHQFQLKSTYFDRGGHWTGHWRFKYWRKGVENILTSTASSVAECKKWGEVDILTAGPKKNSVEVKRWPIPIVFNHHFEESMCSFFFWGNGARQMIEWLRSQTNSFHLYLSIGLQFVPENITFKEEFAKHFNYLADLVGLKNAWQ